MHSAGTRIIIPSSYNGVVQRLTAQSLEVAGTLQMVSGGTITSLGEVRLDGGTLAGSGQVTAATFTNAGVLSPGYSPGKLTLDSPFQQATTGVLDIDIWGTQRGTSYDWLDVSGSAQLGGILRVSSVPSLRLPIGTSFDVLTAQTITGTWDTFVDDTFLGLTWSIVGGNTLRLTTTADGSGIFNLNVAAGEQSQSQLGKPAIANASQVTKTGAGALLLDVINGYSGPTAIDQGILGVAFAEAINRSAAVMIAKDATLDVSRLAEGYTVADGQTIGGSGMVSGSVIFGRGSTLSPGTMQESVAALAVLGASLSTNDGSSDVSIATVPEPSSVAILLTGMMFATVTGYCRARRPSP